MKRARSDKARILTNDAAKCVPAADFARALVAVELTETRERVIEAYGSNPEGLSTPELGRILDPGHGHPHALANLRNADLGKAFAGALGFRQSSRRTWWVGAAFEWDRVSPFGHLMLRIAPTLRKALDADDGEWGTAWRRRSLRKAPRVEPVHEAHFVQRLTRDRQQAFRQAVLNAFGGRCCITGCGVEAALEACHIERYSENPDNSLENSLLLRADLHRLFDAGLAWIEPRGGRLRFRITREVSSDEDVKGWNREPVQEPRDTVLCRERLRRHAEHSDYARWEQRAGR
jgi:hypothetical protein